MSDDPIVDTSHLDRYLRSRHRVEVLNSAWKPALAGAAGATAIIGAVVVGVWVAGPRFSYQTVVIPQVSYSPVEVPKVTMGSPVVVPTIITKDIEIPVTRLVESSPLARTPDERRFSSSEQWAKADVRGRIIRANKNGFDLATEDGGEESFFPAKLDAAGKVEPSEGMKDIIEPYLDDLAACRPAPTGVYLCVAEHNGREVPIRQIPIKLGRPT